MPKLVWTEKKKKKLIDLYSKYDNETGAKKMGMKVQAFRVAATRAGARKSNWFWSAEAEVYLLRNFAVLTAKEMQYTLKEMFGLDKKEPAIYRKYERLIANEAKIPGTKITNPENIVL